MTLPQTLNDAALAKANDRALDIFELGEDSLAALWPDYLAAKARIKEDTKVVDAFQELLALRMGDKTELQLHGVKIAKYARDGVFAFRRFEEEQGVLAEKFTNYVTEKKLDVEALRREHPRIFAGYLARSMRIVK